MSKEMLNDKVVVVTGGAGQLGSEFCSAIAEHGAKVIVADVDIEAASKVASAICAQYSNKAFPALLDINSEKSVIDLIAETHETFGGVDAVINNAYPRNANYGRKLEDVTYTDFCENVNLHLGGYFLVAQKFALYFQTHGNGNIINMSSIYGVMSPRFEVYDNTAMTMPVEYAAIKSAVVHLTRYFAQYFKKSGVRVNCISPGGILADQSKDFLSAYSAHCGTKGMLEPKDIFSALLFLLSDGSKHIVGQNLIIDDGFSL